MNYEIEIDLVLQEICLREAEIVVAGGAENMSQAPFAVRNIRFGTTLGVDYQVNQYIIFFLFWFDLNYFPYCLVLVTLVKLCFYSLSLAFNLCQNKKFLNQLKLYLYFVIR